MGELDGERFASDHATLDAVIPPPTITTAPRETHTA
jgi:hypothetical protein